MASGNQWKDVPRTEPYVKPVNGIVQPPVMPPPNRPGRRTNVLDMLKQVLNALMRRRCAIYFKDPVDSIGLGVPHYHEVIRRPMDLRTIRKRLGNNYYCQAAEAIEDFNLIFENCGTFNMPGTLVHRDGVELKMLFDKHLAQIDLTKEVEVMPKQSQSKPELPSLNPAASVSNQVEVAEKAQPKPNSQPGKSPSGHKGLAPDAPKTPSQSKPELPSLNPAASVSNQVEVAEKAKPKPDSQPGKSPSGLKILDPDSPKTPPNSFCPPPPKLRNYVMVKAKRVKRKRPRLMPAASVPYGRKLEMEEKAKPSVSNQIKVAEKVKPKPNSQSGKGLAPHPPKFPSKSFCPPKLLKLTDEMDVRVKAKREKRKRPRLSTAASVPYEMEMDVEEKAKRVKRKKAKKEKRPNLPSLRPVASLPKTSPEPSKSPSGRESLGPNRFCFKKLDRYIERSNFRKLLRTVRNRKFFSITWIFNEARSWKYYSENKAFDSKLDWPTLEDHAKSSRFKSFDHSVSTLVEKMFENGLRCFAEQSEIRTNIKKTIYLFNQKLDRRRKAVVQEKSLARVLWAYQTWKQKVAARKARESGMPVEAPESPEKAFHRSLDLQSTEDIESEDIEFPEDLESKEGTGAPSGREDLPKPDLSVLECYKMEVVDGVDGQAKPEAKQVS